MILGQRALIKTFKITFSTVKIIYLRPLFKFIVIFRFFTLLPYGIVFPAGIKKCNSQRLILLVLLINIHLIVTKVFTVLLVYCRVFFISFRIQINHYLQIYNKSIKGLFFEFSSY
jgi:hypothetical protein